MKALVLAAALLIPGLAQADIIKCIFTEPFINTTYSMTQSTLTVYEMGVKIKTLKNVSFQIKGPGHFELWNAHKQIVQTVVLDNKGSDGMSDRNYPYSSEYNTKGGHGMLYGGCTSNFLQATGEG